MGASELSIVNNIKKYLDTRNQCWYMKVHGSPFQKTGVPDIIGCIRGQFFAFEVKIPGEMASPIQQAILSKLRKAGAIAYVVRSVPEVKAIFMQHCVN